MQVDNSLHIRWLQAGICHEHHLTQFLDVQGEISKASDIACSSYYENTDKPTGHGVWKAMETAVQKYIKAIRRKNFDRLVAVANPAFKESFKKEVLSILYPSISTC